MPVICQEEGRCLTASISGELDHHRAKEIMRELDRQIAFWGEGSLDGLVASFAKMTRLTEEEKERIRRLLDDMD